MFKKFFKIAKTAIKAYIEKHGIIRSICNTIETVILGSGLVAFLSSIFKRWKTKRQFKKMLKKNGIDEKSYYESKDEPGVYDENGYRLTNEELYRKNMKGMQDIEDMYTDDIRDCVKLIEMYEPEIFNGMTSEKKFKFVKKHNLNSTDLMKKYGLDKESQLKKAIEDGEIDLEDDDLQNLWNEKESTKIGTASKVSGDFHKLPKRQSDKIVICTPTEYAAMEITYECQDFNYSNPSKESEIRRLRRMKFDEAINVVNSYMSWVYLYDKKMWKDWMYKTHNNPVEVWRFMMILFLDDDNAFIQIKNALADKSRELDSEMRGHYTSNRPKITSIEDDKILDKMEDIFERLDEIKMNGRRNTPAGISEEDDDESDDEMINEDLKCSSMEGSEDILDQLDALRNGETDGYEEQDSENEEPHLTANITDDAPIHKPVKMVTRDDKSQTSDEHNLEVLNIPADSYTIQLRALKMINLFNELYKDDHQLANLTIVNMLEDENELNYKIYEKSDVMKKNREEDREHGLAWKIVPSDFKTPEEGRIAYQKYQEGSKTYGTEWKTMIDNRTNYYRDKFKFDTVDEILRILPTTDLDQDTKIGLIAALINSDEDYYNNIVASESAIYYNDAKQKAVDMTQVPIITETSGGPWLEA